MRPIRRISSVLDWDQYGGLNDVADHALSA